jgi:DNA mismatch endonuclease (patch repair protein)
MDDHLTKEKRSEVISRIKSKNTKPELLIRSHIHKFGYRFRIHSSHLPVKPDLVLSKYKNRVTLAKEFRHNSNEIIFTSVQLKLLIWYKISIKLYLYT